MDLCNIKDIRALLEEHGFKFSKSLGQNFLIASWVPQRIAEESGITADDGVIEIGPGVGCLTERLCERAGKVVAVELDKRLLPVLGITLKDKDNVSVINGDIMGADIDAIISDNFAGLTPKVCANLPYNITTPVLTKLIDSHRFDSITVMIQKEVAQRICAEPGSADYGAFSVYTAFYTEPEMLFDVPNSCFEPRPKVTSTVVNLKCRKAPAIECDEKLFFRIVRAAFNQRRKTLVNALSSAFSNIPKDAIVSSVENSGLDVRIRGEVLGLQEFARITENIGQFLK